MFFGDKGRLTAETESFAAGQPAVQCDRLVMRFGGLLAVNELSFSVREGDIHGLIGPNGAGKTTVFNVISGFYRPASGRVLYRGEDISGLKMHAIAAKGLVRTFQHSSLFQELTVRENILVGCYLHRKPALWSALRGAKDQEQAEQWTAEILEFFDLSARQNERAGELPHGLQRAAGIAVAMAAKPRVLLLDEPFTGMNPEETLRMMALMEKIKSRGVTLLLVEHDMRAVMGLCDRITVVNFGKLLVEGAPDEVRAHPEVIKAYLGESGGVTEN